jgi:uncharacterized membrane protein
MTTDKAIEAKTTINTGQSKQRFSTEAYRKTALFGYFSLLAFMPLWLLVLNPSEGLSPLLTIVMFIVPLLLPLRGLLKGEPYTFAWSNFIVLIYFLHSLTTLWVSPEDRVWASLELLFATIMFLAGTYYAKYKGQELGLSIRKKKDDKAEDKN